LAIFISAIIVFLLFTFGSLAIAAVVPNSQLKLESGLMQALTSMLASVKMSWALPVLAFCVAFGSLGGVLSWISGPSKGLLTTAKDGLLPEKLTETTKAGAPKNMMLIQGVIVTVLASLYFIMKNVSVAFFLLSALTVAVYIIMYILMYAAAIVLRKKQPNMERPYKAPALYLLAIVGILAAVFALVLSFIPPAQLPVGNPVSYVAIVAIGTVGFFIIPLIIANRKKAKNK
jgi:amino acid transporter